MVYQFLRNSWQISYDPRRPSILDKWFPSSTTFYVITTNEFRSYCSNWLFYSEYTKDVYVGFTLVRMKWRGGGVGGGATHQSWFTVVVVNDVIDTDLFLLFRKRFVTIVILVDFVIERLIFLVRSWTDRFDIFQIIRTSRIWGYEKDTCNRLNV